MQSEWVRIMLEIVNIRWWVCNREERPAMRKEDLENGQTEMQNVRGYTAPSSETDSNQSAKITELEAEIACLRDQLQHAVKRNVAQQI